MEGLRSKANVSGNGEQDESDDRQCLSAVVVLQLLLITTALYLEQQRHVGAEGTNQTDLID